MQRIRFRSPHGHRVLIATLAILFLMVAQAPAGTLDQIRQSGKLTIGYSADASPFSYSDTSGNAAGYAVVLGQKIAEQLKADLRLPTLNVQWVPVTKEGRFRDLQQGKVDLLCGADSETLARRKTADFSIPIFPGGIAALVRTDSSRQLREVLTKGQAVVSRPLWRGSPSQILGQQTFSVVTGTTSEKWLAGKLDKFQLSAKVAPVSSYADGISRVLDGTSNVFFGERAIILDMIKRSPSARDLIVLDRHFTNERIALALPRGNDDFRLVVDRTLSQLFNSPDFSYLYAKWFGEPDEFTLNFFSVNALPE
jgi:ABC-type amino acid transport substrate-binding protein